MRRRTESGRHYSDSDDALSDPPSGRRHNKHKDADTDLGNALKDILDKGSLGQTPAGMGIDTPRASFDNLSILDPTNNHPASLPPPQTKPVHPLSSLPKTKNAHAPLSSLIQPRSDGRSDGSDSDSSLPRRPKSIDTTPFNSQDGSNFTPLQPPPQAPGTPVVGSALPIRGTFKTAPPTSTPTSNANTSNPSSSSGGPSLPPGIPVRRRKSSAARETARSIALAKKSQSIVTNLEAAQGLNPNAAMQRNREKAEAEEERLLAREEKAIRHKRTMERSLKKAAHNQTHAHSSSSVHASSKHHHHHGSSHHHHHHRRSPQPTSSSSSNGSNSNTSSDVSDLSDGYEGGEDSNTISNSWKGDISGSDTSDDDKHIPTAADLPPSRSRTSSRMGVPPMGQTLNGAPEQLPDLTIRILLLGDSGVGKTSLMLRYSDNKFAYSLIATAGVDFKVKNMDIPNPAYNKSAAAGLQNEEELNSISEEEKELRILLSKPFLRVRCQIWDTAGQEKFHVITRAYYRGAHAIVCTYDVTDSDSFRNIDYWLANIHTHTIGKGGGDDSDESGGSGAVQTMIIGNKTDLHHKRTVTKSQGEALAKECGVTYIETSAKDGTNVNDAFQRLATDVVTQLDRERRGAGKLPAKKRGSKKWLPAGFLPSQQKRGSKTMKRKGSAEGCVLS
ncbi:hypothetical protein TrLO_g11670 [Triparma laevis f. longispina]|uniref:P-loop containing nucleoside triphosphate hydrolase protein n=1 Tax=Triparma laevis f. longispina TaxID=1714387 RepID=A0A9W7CGC3_9STRA|nr:hypothetical protein TrLO_g11670 [Triparma laevis f. longispina]